MNIAGRLRMRMRMQLHRKAFVRRKAWEGVAGPTRPVGRLSQQRRHGARARRHHVHCVMVGLLRILARQRRHLQGTLSNSGT